MLSTFLSGGTGGDILMDVAASGGVGIGTTAPLCKLDIRTNSASLIDAGATVNIEEDAAWTQGLALYINNADVYNGDYASACIGVANSGSNIIITAGAKVVNNPAASNGYKTLNSTVPSVYRQVNGAHIFYGDTGKTVNTLYTPTERMRIDDDGKVGIGTAAPGFALQVDEGTTATYAASIRNANDNLQLKLGTTTGALLNIQGSIISTDAAYNISLQADGGNVGIGTSAPGANLDVRAPSGQDGLIVLYGNAAGTEADARLMLAESVNYGMTFEYDGVANVGYIGMNDNVAPTGAWSKRIRMSRSGTEVAFTAGNVGIGTSAPAYDLQVAGNIDATRLYVNAGGNATDPIIRVQSDTNTGIFFPADDTIAWTTGGSERMRIKSDGNVGIGTSAPIANLDVDLNQTNVALSGDNAAHFGGQHHSSGQIMGITLGYREANTNYRKIGLVAEGLGDNAARQNFHILVDSVNDGGSAQLSDKKFTIYGLTGHAKVWNDLTVGGTITESSSIAIKENIFDFNTTLDKINRVRPVKYNKKTNKNKKEIGFIAEELAEIFPELVENDENGNPISVNYTRAVTVLFDGFKQMYKELKEIKEKIK
jgi:hypothetical protein